ncbi:MAG: copper amine oxidase N-terminal domain-containing protein [Tepidanaerobacteraceae bacterium]
MRKVFKVLICVLVIFCIFMPNLFAAPITVTIDGEAVAFTDAEPFVDANYRTQCPLRVIAEALGCTVDWNQEEQKITVQKEYTETDTLVMRRYYTLSSGRYDTYYEHLRKLELTVANNLKTLHSYYSLYGQRSSDIDGFSEEEMDTSPIIKDNRTYLPVRYLAEAFGYDVGWDEANKTVIISSQNTIYGTYIGDIVSSFDDICAIALYETDYTSLNTNFVGLESAVITFKDGRVIDVTDSFVDATEELKKAYIDLEIDIDIEDIAYAGKIEYDFRSEENQIFMMKVRVNVEDKEGNMGYQTYNFVFNLAEGQGGYL